VNRDRGMLRVYLLDVGRQSEWPLGRADWTAIRVAPPLVALTCRVNELLRPRPVIHECCKAAAAVDRYHRHMQDASSAWLALPGGRTVHIPVV